MMLRHLEQFDEAARDRERPACDARGAAWPPVTSSATRERSAPLPSPMRSSSTRPQSPAYHAARVPADRACPGLERSGAGHRVGPADVVGADVFVEWDGDARISGGSIESAVEGTPLQLKMVDNRGTRVYPPTGTPTDCVDSWRCRFVTRGRRRGGRRRRARAAGRLTAPAAFTHVEKLHVFDGEDGFTKAQGRLADLRDQRRRALRVSARRRIAWTTRAARDGGRPVRAPLPGFSPSLESLARKEREIAALEPDFVTATAFSGVNQAFYDLLAKREQVPVWRLFQDKPAFAACRSTRRSIVPCRRARRKNIRSRR